MRGRREEELPSSSAAEQGLGKTIRAWRHFRGLSVTDLALRSGFGENGRGYISRIEHGQIRRPSEERLERIAAALGVQRADLLLHRMPEAQGDRPAHDLDEAIMSGKELLKKCVEQSFDWARLQLLLARLYRERAAAAHTTAAKYAALTEAQHCIECALLVFTADTAPRSFREATKLKRDIDDLLETSIITGGQALLKRCPPHSLDGARIHVLLAACSYERATALQGKAALAALTEAHLHIEAALPIFTQKRATRSLKEATHLAREITRALKRFTRASSPAEEPPESDESA